MKTHERSPCATVSDADSGESQDTDTFEDDPDDEELQEIFGSDGRLESDPDEDVPIACTTKKKGVAGAFVRQKQVRKGQKAYITSGSKRRGPKSLPKKDDEDSDSVDDPRTCRE